MERIFSTKCLFMVSDSILLMFHTRHSLIPRYQATNFWTSNHPPAKCDKVFGQPDGSSISFDDSVVLFVGLIDSHT